MPVSVSAAEAGLARPGPMPATAPIGAASKPIGLTAHKRPFYAVTALAQVRRPGLTDLAKGLESYSFYAVESSHHPGRLVPAGRTGRN
jgi:hypothetical protein